MFLVSAYRFPPTTGNPPFFAISNFCTFYTFLLGQVTLRQILFIFGSALTCFPKNKFTSSKSISAFPKYMSTISNYITTFWYEIYAFGEVRHIFSMVRLATGKCCYTFSTSLLSFRKNRNTFSSEGTTFCHYMPTFSGNKFHWSKSYQPFHQACLFSKKAEQTIKNVNLCSVKRVVLPLMYVVSFPNQADIPEK